MAKKNHPSMTTHPPLQKPDVIPFVSLPGMLQRMDIMLECYALRRPWILERAAELNDDTVINAYDAYVSKYRRERDQVVSLLATAEQQEEQHGNEQQPS